MAAHRFPRLMTPLLALGVCACDSTEPSEQGQWALSVDLRDHLEGHDQPALVLVGSTFDLDLIRHQSQSGEREVSPELAACVPLSPSGSVIASGDEFVVYDVGPGSVEIPAPIEACPELSGDEASLSADRWSVIGTDEGLVVWSLWFEQVLDAFSAGPAGQFPAELGRTLGVNGVPDPSPGRSALVAVGGTFQLDPVLVEDQNAEPRVEVRWSARAARLQTVQEHEYLLAREFEDDPNPTRLFGRVDAPDVIDTSFVIELADNAVGVAVQAWPNVPQVEVVPIEQITELELVPVYGLGDAEREWSEPVGVIALAHDAQGNRIVAPPVEWSLTEGRLAVYEVGPDQVSDVLSVDDICVERPEQAEARSATIEARLGDLVASTELQWTALVEGPPATPDAEECGKQGCDCSVDASPRGSIAALLGLLGLGFVRRRRG